MASSAFKSTTRRTLHGVSAAACGDGRHASPKAAPPSPCPRHARAEHAAGSTRANSLFDHRGAGAGAWACASSPSSSPHSARCRERGREVARRKGGRAGSGRGRARSVSGAPPQRRVSPESGSDGGGEDRRASRSRSRPPALAGEIQPYRSSEIDAEVRDVSGELQSWKSRRSVSGSIETFRDIDENILSESCGAVSEFGTHLERVIVQRNNSTAPVFQVLEIPPEFDPDSVEFISDISGYAIDLQNEYIVETPPEFVPLGAKLAPDIRHHSTKTEWEQMGIPLEFDPDTDELPPDITEYTTKLKQSREQARKLRADLAAEEQREQELSRVLKGIVTAPNFAETHKRRSRRKSSTERLKASKHLTEEAMNYFEECVSVSILDSADFSSIEDPQPNSGSSISQESNIFFHKEEPNYFGDNSPTDQLAHQEESHDNQTQCSIEDLDAFNTPRSIVSYFSFTDEPSKTVENHDARQYIGSFGKGINKEIRESRSNYSSEEYLLQKLHADLLTNIATDKDRIEYGGLLICNIRTF